MTRVSQAERGRVASVGEFVSPDQVEPARKPVWRYVASGSRDLRLDLLRGYAVVAMVVDHIGGDSPSWLYALTGGDQFFVSAAETFVFVSGVTVGIVYGGRALALGWRQAARKIVGRAWTLYALAVWLAIASASIDAVLGSPRSAATVATPGRFVLEVIAVRRTYHLADVMLLYALLMLVAPLCLALLLRGHWWLVLAGSWTLWAAYQVWPSQLVVPWPIADSPLFNLAAWQVLFVTGMVLGFKRQTVGRWADESRLAAAGNARLVVMMMLFAAMVWLYRTDGAVLDRFGASLGEGDPLEAWFDKSSLPPARIAACAITFALGWMLVSRYWRFFHGGLGPFLLPLGQAALYAYAVHVLLVSGVDGAERWVWGAAPVLPGRVNMAIQVGTVLVVWMLTRRRFLRALVAPLGGLPLRRLARNGGGTTVVVPTPALTAVLVALVISLGLMLARA